MRQRRSIYGSAEAAHLSEDVESADWLSAWLRRGSGAGSVTGDSGKEFVEERTRVRVTDEKSVYDYLADDSNSLSTDRRAAIEGALLGEALRQANEYE